MELKKQKINKNQETDGYETDKRPRTEKSFLLIRKMFFHKY